MKIVWLWICWFTGMLSAQAKSWNVSPEDGRLGIQQAIDRAEAGDTIFVQRGHYKPDPIVIRKSLYLKGVGLPVIDGNKQIEIISVRASGVIIEGFEIRNSGFSSYNDIAALSVVDTRNVTIRKNRFINNFFGVYIQHVQHCLVQDNFFQSDATTELNAANGIHCWKSDHITITGNHIQGHRDGIYLEFVTQSLIEGNMSENNIRYGLHFMFSHEDTYRDNIFRHNGSGVAVMFTKKVTMIDNTFEENWGGASYGLLLKEITDSHLQGNNFYRNTIGILIDGGTRIRIEGNQFKNNGWAMKAMANCENDTITGNNFFGNTFDVATNGTLVLSNFSGNYWDKYEGYDLKRDGIGDIPFRPVSLYSMIVERMPTGMMLFRSFIVNMLDKAEKIIPGITPEQLLDEKPFMKPLPYRELNHPVK